MPGKVSRINNNYIWISTNNNDNHNNNNNKRNTFVKLHSELALPTELQLDRVGVDFVFPPSQLTNRKLDSLREKIWIFTWMLISGFFGDLQ